MDFGFAILIKKIKKYLVCALHFRQGKGYHILWEEDKYITNDEKGIWSIMKCQ